MSITVDSSDSISDIEGYACFSEVQVGGNGDSDGPPEYDCGTGGSSDVSGRRTWDSQLSDGLDTGSVAVQLQVNPGGGSNGVLWSVTGGTQVPLSFSDASYGAITSVQIRAAVQYSEMKFTWTALILHFYKNGSLIETITVPSNQAPKVDTTGASDPVAAEMITTVTPTNSDNTKVTVSGTIRMQFSYTDVPDPEGIFGQIYVFAD